MTIYYLYIKQHAITGLKYFGKTDIKDPLKYNGSGTDWRKHLEENGDNVITLELFEFSTKEERTEFAINFSRENNIVESTEWANLKPENGKCGGGGFKMTEESKQKISKANKGLKRSDEFKSYISSLKSGITLSEDHKRKIGKSSKGRIYSEETKRKLSLSNKEFRKNNKIIMSEDSKIKLSEKLKNRICYNNGITTVILHPHEAPPEGFVKGRIKGRKHSNETKAKISSSRKTRNKSIT